MQRIAEDWEAFARRDPMWAVLTDREPGAWEPDDFYATGQETFDRILQMSGINPASKTILDFGCGVGRLTYPAWKASGAKVLGIDISETMVQAARARFNEAQHRGLAFRQVAPSPLLLELTDTRFDLWISEITLQHIPALEQYRYIRRLSSLLVPGGMAVFHVTVGRDQWADRANGHRVMEMHGVDLALVRGALEMSGCSIVDLRLNAQQSTWSPNWTGVWVIARKEPAAAV